MADRRHAEWIAVYVETPRHHRLSDADRDRVARTLRLAEQMGGEAVTIPGQDVAEDMIRYAQSRNVTEIVIGKSLRSGSSKLWRGTIVHDLIRKSGDIAIHVITEADEGSRRTPTSAVCSDPSLYVSLERRSGVCRRGCGEDSGIVSVTSEPLDGLFDRSAVKRRLVGTRAVDLRLILSVLVYDFFFVSPIFTFTVASPHDLLALSCFLSSRCSLAI